MSARRETYRVQPTHGGWLVDTACGRKDPGTYADREHVIVRALAAERDAKPRRLRRGNSPGVWRAGVLYPDEPTWPTTPPLPSSSGSRCGIRGVPHVSSRKFGKDSL